MADPLITGILLDKLISEIISGAKKIGANGFKRWEESRFSAKIARRINSIGKVKTLWSQDKELLITDFYYPPKIKIESDVLKISKASDLPEGASIIEGIAGQGKSIFLRNLAFMELKSNEGLLVPIFIELRGLTDSMGLRGAIVKQLYAYDIDADDDSVEYVLGSGRFAVLLDGFDEVESRLVNDLISDLEAIASRHQKLRLIVTSRPYDEIQKSTLFRKIKIEPLKVSDYVEFLKAGGFSTAAASSIRDAIQKSTGEISGLITTPLMLTLVGQLYQNELEIPDNTPEFFERIFRHTFVTHDKLKAGIKRKRYTNLGDRKLQEIFEAFCFICMCEGVVVTVSASDYGGIFDQAMEYVVDCKCDADDFLQEITKGACLMLPEGDERIHFLHKSLLDYFSASFIKKADSDFSDRFYEQVTESPEPWFQVLAFLQYIDSRNFYKKFLLIEIKEILEKDFLFLELKDERKMLLFLEQHHPEAGVIFRPGVGDELQTIAFGPFSKPKKFSFKKLNNSLTLAISKTVPDVVSKSMIILESRGDYREDELGVFLRMRYVIKIWGSKRFFEALSLLGEVILREQRDANKLIEVSKKKSSLLNKMKESKKLA